MFKSLKLLFVLLLLLVATITLWYVSGVVFLVGIGLLIGVIAGIGIGWWLNDWYEQTSLYKWQRKRQAKKGAAKIKADLATFI